MTAIANGETVEATFSPIMVIPRAGLLDPVVYTSLRKARQSAYDKHITGISPYDVSLAFAARDPYRETRYPERPDALTMQNRATE